MCQPGNADPISTCELGHVPPYGLDAADDFMVRDDKNGRIRELAVDDVEVGAADSACQDSKQQLLRLR